MNMRWCFFVCVAVSCISPARADDFQIGVGAGFFADHGADLQINYRKTHSHYQIGYRYIRWQEIFNDPYTGTPIDETQYTFTGPVLNYLFNADGMRSWYVGVSLLHSTQTIVPLVIAAPSGTVSSTDPYFGGGYTGHFGKSFFYNLGFYISPTYKSENQTAVSSSEQNGNFDIQLQAGLSF